MKAFVFATLLVSSSSFAATVTLEITPSINAGSMQVYQETDGSKVITMQYPSYLNYYVHGDAESARILCQKLGQEMLSFETQTVPSGSQIQTFVLKASEGEYGYGITNDTNRLKTLICKLKAEPKKRKFFGNN